MILPMNSDSKIFNITLESFDSMVIRSVLSYIVENNENRNLHKRIKEFTKSFIDQDMEYSKEGFLGEANFSFTPSESEILAYCLFQVIKEVFENQRILHTNEEVRDKVRTIFTLIKKITEQHIDILKGL